MDDSDYHDAGLVALGSVRGRGSLGSRFTYQNLNCIFTHPKSGAKVFIGNLSAANTKSELEENNITRVVNCQEPSSRNFFEGEPNYQYYRFNIASYQVHEWLNELLPVNMKPESTSEALAFFLITLNGLINAWRMGKVFWFIASLVLIGLGRPGSDITCGEKAQKMVGQKLIIFDVSLM